MMTTNFLQEIDSAWLDSGPSEAEQSFAIAWVTAYPTIDLHTEVLIIPGRKYRVDFLEPLSKTAIEVQGYTDHMSVRGVLRDQEKLLLAAVHGYQILQIPSTKVSDPEWLERIAQVIRLRGGTFCLTSHGLHTY